MRTSTTRRASTTASGELVTIVAGLVFHPSIAGHVVTSRWGEIYKFVGGAGTIGFFSVFGGLFSLIVLAPSALNSSPAFISDIGGSQNIMAVMAVAVGIAMVATWLTRLGERFDRRWRVGFTALALALAAGAVVQTAVLSAHWTPKSGQMFAAVDDATAAELAHVDAQIPASDETVVSQGVVGRFAQRHTYYPYFDVFADGQTVPLFGHTVYVVLVPRQGIEEATPAGTMKAVTLMRHLGAHQLVSRTTSTPRLPRAHGEALADVPIALGGGRFSPNGRGTPSMAIGSNTNQHDHLAEMVGRIAGE